MSTKQNLVPSLTKLYDMDYFSSKARELVDGMTEEEMLLWATHDATKALTLLIDGSITETLFSWKQGKFPLDEVQEAQGYCNGLERTLEFIDDIKKREI